MADLLACPTCNDESGVGSLESPCADCAELIGQVAMKLWAWDRERGLTVPRWEGLTEEARNAYRDKARELIASVRSKLVSDLRARRQSQSEI